jgi:hypothetical protein
MCTNTISNIFYNVQKRQHIPAKLYPLEWTKVLQIKNTCVMYHATD